MCRTSTLTFAPGETSKQTSVVVLEDDLPEDTETFYVALSNPQGGAEIGANQKVSINILSNDDAHGIIEFSEVSLKAFCCINLDALHTCMLRWN